MAAKKKKKKLNHLQQRQRKERLKKLAENPPKFKPPKIQSKKKAKTAKQRKQRAAAIAKNPQHGQYSARNLIRSGILQDGLEQYESLLNSYLSKIRPEALERVATGRIYSSGNAFFIWNNEQFQFGTNRGIEDAIEEFMERNFSPYDYKDINLDKGSAFDEREEF